MSGHPRTRRDQMNSREKEFLRTVRSLPRPYPDPAIEWQLKLYSQLTRTKRKLDRFPASALLSNEHLKPLRIVRGADHNVDEAKPVDLEARFFMPEVGNPLKNLRDMHLHRYMGWGQPDHGLDTWEWRDPNLQPALSLLKYYRSIISIVDNSYTFAGCNPYWFPASFRKFNPTRIQRFTDRFWIQDFYYYRSPKLLGPDPEVPHFIMSLIDTSRDVPDDQILKSELLMGILCMRHILTLRHWPGHYTLPLLVFSYHEGRGRIIQMHCEHDQLHIRMSRHLNFQSRGIMRVPRDGLIMVKWFLSKPIGNTAFSSLPQKENHEEDSRQRGSYKDPGTSWPLEIPAEEHEGNIAHDQ
ncbi:hypothetical protein V8C42DRAFT_343673 [Trichoderma barbatum]